MMDTGDRNRGVSLFLLIAFAWSWPWSAAIWATGGVTGPLFTLLAFGFMWGPAVAALVCAGLYDKGRRVAALGVRPRFTGKAWLWLFLSWAIPAALLIAATVIDWAGPQVSMADPGAQITAQATAAFPDQDVRTTPTGVGWAIAAAGLIFGALLNWPVMINEELGWRGWLWGRWRRLGFWRGNILIGAVWGVWHAPVIALGYNYPGMPVWGPILMTVLCIMGAPLIGLVREKGGSVWHACLFHGTFNAGAGIGLALVSQGTAFPWQGIFGVGGAVAFALGWILIFLWLRRRPEPDRNVTSFA